MYNISRFVETPSCTGHNFTNQTSSNFVKFISSSSHSITSNQSMNQIDFPRNQSNHVPNLCEYQISNSINSGNHHLEQFYYSSNQLNYLSNHHSYLSNQHNHPSSQLNHSLNQLIHSPNQLNLISNQLQHSLTQQTNFLNQLNHSLGQLHHFSNQLNHILNQLYYFNNQQDYPSRNHFVVAGSPLPHIVDFYNIRLLNTCIDFNQVQNIGNTDSRPPEIFNICKTNYTTINADITKNLIVTSECFNNINAAQLQSNNLSFKVLLLNSQSVKNKVIRICEFLREKNIVACGLTETWLTLSDESVLREFKDMGYNIIHNPRKGKRGGGVGFMFRSELIVKPSKSTGKFKRFEHFEVTLRGTNKIYLFSTVYRTGYLTSIEKEEFLCELQAHVESLIITNYFVILWGDFNFHIENDNDLFVKEFLNLLKVLGFVQMVKQPTHSLGGTLDLVFVKENDIECRIMVYDEHSSEKLSDHFAIELSLPDEPTFKCNKIKYSCRKVNSVDLVRFSSDLKNKLMPIAVGYSVDEQINHLKSAILYVMDQHAPVQTHIKSTTTKIFRHKNITEARKIKRRAERKFLKTRTEVDKYNLNTASRNLSKIVKEENIKFYHEKLNKAKGDSKGTYDIVNQLLNKTKEKKLPEFTDPMQLARKFELYFRDKIVDLYAELDKETDKEQTLNLLKNTHIPNQHTYFSSFNLITPDLLISIIKTIKKKYSSVDEIPTFFLETINSTTLPFLLNIVNQSLSSGEFPDSLKVSHVIPLLKKHTLDANILSHFRPVINISFISKILEKCALLQLLQHLEDNQMLTEKQSAYRINHSCETALIKIFDDIMTDVDRDTSVVVTLLDFSSAFDTINHELMVSKLEHLYGLKGTVLKWFRSYLSNRKFCVKIKDCLSEGQKSLYGVPQGSILGPVLFILFLQDSMKIIQSYGFKFHLFADDIQIYVPLSKSKAEVSALQSCLKDISIWTKNNFLKLNQSKTKFLNIHSKNCSSKIEQIEILTEVFQIEPQAKNLGFVIDSKLSLSVQISNVCRRGYFFLRNLWRISAKLNSIKIKTQMAHACIISQIDYCSSLYYNLPKKEIRRLQKLMNSTIRFIFNIKRPRTNVTAYLKMCHLLPVNLRLKFKICVIIFKCLYNSAPTYLQNMITNKSSLESLRIYTDKTILQQQFPQNNFKNRRFSVAGPKL